MKISTSKKFKVNSQEIFEDKTSATDSSLKLDVKLIRPTSNDVMSGWRYAVGNYSILFLSVDSEQVLTLMKKHIRRI